MQEVQITRQSTLGSKWVWRPFWGRNYGFLSVYPAGHLGLRAFTTFFVAPFTQVIVFWITLAPGLRTTGGPTGATKVGLGVALAVALALLVGVAVGVGLFAIGVGVGFTVGVGCPFPSSDPSCSDPSVSPPPRAVGEMTGRGATVGTAMGVAETVGVAIGVGVDVVTLPTCAIADASDAIQPREM